MVILNKPNKPDYSLAKAYRPISLLECIAKLLEKIVAKSINTDIISADLLPISQFGSHPQHNMIDTVATLVHKIQATRQTGNIGALLLFNISGFFDNVNPERATQVFRQKGFPNNVCRWTQLFLTGRSVTLKMGTTLSEPCHVHNGTPQGSPLSPILSAL